MKATTVQAWIEPISDDPEAVSAFGVARARLAPGRSLRSLRRLRLFEIRGELPARAVLEELLHRSIQFYNPHKERCHLRLAASEEAPLRAGELAVLVFERDGERRAAAERWWRHEIGGTVEVSEGVAWLVAFEEQSSAERCAEDLALVRGRRHGLLCNPHAQQCRIAGAEPPLPWIFRDEGRQRRRAGPGAVRPRKPRKGSRAS
jgi:hypothetical protein